MARPAPLLVSLLLLAAAAGPAAGRRAWLPERLLQQGTAPESSGADGAENQPEPIGVIQGPTYGATAGGAAAAPSAETPSSPYRFADVGSGSAADVQAAIAAGNAAGFAAAAAAAGPEAAGRWADHECGLVLLAMPLPPCLHHACALGHGMAAPSHAALALPRPHNTCRAVTDAIRKGSGPALVRIVNEADGAASDALLTVNKGGMSLHGRAKVVTAWHGMT